MKTNKQNFFHLLIIPVVAAVLLSACGNQPQAENKQPEPSSEASTTQVPAMQIDKSKTYTAILKTDKGDITIALTANKTPITVNNFVVLARKNFYNGKNSGKPGNCWKI